MLLSAANLKIQVIVCLVLLMSYFGGGRLLKSRGNMFGSYLTVNSIPLYEANSTFSSVLLINHVHAFKQLVENTILFHAFLSTMIHCEPIQYLAMFSRNLDSSTEGFNIYFKTRLVKLPATMPV